MTGEHADVGTEAADPGGKNTGHGAGHACAGGGRDTGGTRSRVEPIPASIVQAICKVQTTLEAVKKSQRNAHGGYNFASTDDIYAALTRKMGEVGLSCLSLEDRCEIKRMEGKDGKPVQWAHMEFSFVLATAQATWSDPRAKRTLYLLVTGPQTFQAAQSYAEKAFLRSMFKLATGDMDLDSMPQADNEDDQISLAGGRKRKSSAEGKRDGSVKVFNEIRAAVASAINPEMLQHLRETYTEQWAEMPRAWAETLDEDYSVKMDSFGVQAAAE